MLLISFWQVLMFLIAFLSLKQAKNEGELGIIHGKDVRTWRPNTPSKGGGTWVVAGCRNDVARLAHFSQ